MTIEAYGVRVAIEIADPELLAEATPLFPPGWTESGGEPAVRFTLAVVDDRYELHRDDELLSGALERATALTLFDSHLRLSVAERTPDLTFIHAGAVAVDGRAIVLPGQSFAGKTTLTAALLRQGASYLSDECAVLDADGRVHPYARRLSLRPSDARRGTPPDPTVAIPAHEFGAPTADGAVPIGVIATLVYRAGAPWEPQESTQAEGALALLANAVRARAEPAHTLSLITAAVAGARALKGERGEADEAATALIALMTQ
jgi:hypothetical protein